VKEDEREKTNEGRERKKEKNKGEYSTFILNLSFLSPTSLLPLFLTVLSYCSFLCVCCAFILFADLFFFFFSSFHSFLFPSPLLPFLRNNTVSHLICGGCRTMLAYPTGATSVRCAVCTTVNQTGVAPQTMANIRCQGCNTHLMYSSGATSVRCALCDFVTQVGGAATIPQQPQLQQRVQQQQQGSSSSLGPGAQGGSSMPAQQNSDFLQRQNSNSLYVIQNPSVEGEEVFSMAIGVKQDSKPVP